MNESTKTLSSSTSSDLKLSWPSLTPKDALSDIETMCETICGKPGNHNEEEEYKRYVNVFLNLERRKLLHHHLKEAIDVTRHVNIKSHLRINMLRYPGIKSKSGGEELEDVLRSGEKGKRIETRLDRGLEISSQSRTKQYTKIEHVAESFKRCNTPQMFLETIEEVFPKDHRLHFAEHQVKEFTSTLQGGHYHETENMRTDMERQIGKCFYLNQEKIMTKTLKQCVSDIDEVMKRIQTSNVGDMGMSLREL